MISDVGLEEKTLRSLVEKDLEEKREKIGEKRGLIFSTEHTHSSSSREGFRLSAKQGRLSLQATTPHDLLFGAYSSSFLSLERLCFSPFTYSRKKGSINYCRVGCGKRIKIGERLVIAVPEQLYGDGWNEEAIESFCLRVLQLGFHALIFSSKGKGEVVEATDEGLHLFRRYGLKLYVEPEVQLGSESDPLIFSPLDPEVREVYQEIADQLRERIGFIDGIYWSSRALPESCPQHPALRELTEYEHLVEEMRFWEGALDREQSLIFEPPEEERDKLLLQLPLDAGRGTVLSDGGKSFRSLCRRGELWFSLPISGLEERLMESEGKEQAFHSVLYLDEVPSSDRFLDAYIAAFHLARGSVDSYLAIVNQWFVDKTGTDYFQMRKSLRVIEGIALEVEKTLQFIEEREGVDPLKDHRLVVSCLIKRVELVKIDLKEGSFPDWLEKRVKRFVVDARRILYFFVQNFHVPYSFVLQAEDYEEGAVTSIGDEGEGLSNLVQIRSISD